MDQTIDERAPEQAGLQRRTLLKGAAWSVPAVLLVGATPAFAASNLKVDVTAISVSVTGKTYVFTLTTKNLNSISVTIGSVDLTGRDTKEWPSASASGTELALTPGATSSAIVVTATRKDKGASFPALSFKLKDNRGTTSDVNVNITNVTGTTVTFTDS